MQNTIILNLVLIRVITYLHNVFFTLENCKTLKQMINLPISKQQASWKINHIYLDHVFDKSMCLMNVVESHSFSQKSNFSRSKENYQFQWRLLS